MHRYGRRLSRVLIGVLVIILVLGLAFYLKNNDSKQAGANAAQSNPPAPAPSPVKPVPAASAAVKPAIQPVVPTTVTPTVASAATTRPAALLPPAASPTTPAAPSLSSTPLADAQAKMNAGQLLPARKILNDALLAGALSPGEVESAKKMIAEISQTVVFSPKVFPDDEFGGTYTVQPGDRLSRIADKYEIPWPALLRLNGMSDPRKLQAGRTLKVIHGPFNVVVSKSKYVMDIYLGPPGEKGSVYVTSFPVGLGKDDSTPTGTWLVEAGKKIKNPVYYSPRGEGIIDADDPENPLGERWIGLTGIDGHAVGKASYGIHGTIDETSIGKMESMGCIRLKNADVEWVFDLLVEGKSTVIVEE